MLQELAERPRDYNVEFEFGEVTTLNPPFIQVIDVSFGYKTDIPQDSERTNIFTNISFGVHQDSRICIVGPNGAGKSTLIKLISGELNCDEGEIRRNSKMRVGVYNQHFVDKVCEVNVFDWM